MQCNLGDLDLLSIAGKCCDLTTAPTDLGNTEPAENNE